jgi:LPXTG-site transpeptidase (sortase) family protein
MRFFTRTSVLTIGLVGVASCATYTLVATHHPISASKRTAPVVTRSTTQPAEHRPEDIGFTWRGQANDPKSISIADVDIQGYLQNVGVDQNQQVAVPTNIHFGGWFVQSARPGAKGLSIIDGHVLGHTTDAIFTKLHSVSNGDRIRIEMGSGAVYTYEVFHTGSYAVADTAAVLFSQDPTIRSQLNLVTCIGRWQEQAKSYDKRFVVSAKLVR